MRNLPILFALIVGIIAGCARTEPVRTTSLSYLTPYGNYPEHLNGQVKSVKELSFWAIENNGRYIKGEPVTRKERDSIKWTSDFTAYYNPDGVLTRSDFVSYNGEIRSWVTELENGLMKKATWITGDTSRVYFELTYDGNNHMLSAKRFRSNVDTLLNSYSYFTDEKGNIVEARVYNPDGKLMSTYKFKLNDKYLTEGLMTYSDKDSLVSSSKILYNDRGFYTRAEYLNGAGEVRRTDDLDYTEYDEKGNWLRAIVSREGKVTFITERIYEYY